MTVPLVLKKYRWTFRVCTKLPAGKLSKPKIRELTRTCSSSAEANQLCAKARASFLKANMTCELVDPVEEVTS